MVTVLAPAVGRAATNTLAVAARNGDLVTVRRLVEQQPTWVHLPDDEGATPLHAAATMGRAEVVKYLAGHGADLNARDVSSGGTPLLLAAMMGHYETAEALLAAGADVNAASFKGTTPLHVAAFQGHGRIVTLLIAKGAELNARNRTGVTPLQWAISQGQQECAELLAQAGAEVESPPDVSKQGAKKELSPADRIAALEHKLKEVSAEAEQARSKIERLTRDQQAGEERTAAERAERQQAQTQALAALQTELALAATNLAACENARSVLESDLQAERRTARQEVERLKEEAARAALAWREAEAGAQQTRHQLDLLQQEYAARAQQWKTESATMQHAQATAVSDLNARLTQAQSQLAETEGRLKMLEARYQAEQQARSDETAELRARIAALAAGLREAELNHQRAQRNGEDLVKERDSLARQLQAAGDKAVVDAKFVAAEMDRQKELIVKQALQLKERDSTLDVRDAEYAKIEAKLDELMAAKAEAEARVRTVETILQAERKAAEAEAAKRKTQVAQAGEQARDARVQQAQAAEGAARAEAKAAQDETARLKERLVKQAAGLKEMEAKAAAKDAEITELKNEINEAMAWKSEQEAQARTLDARLRTQRGTTALETEKLKGELARAETRIGELEEQLKTAAVSASKPVAAAENGELDTLKNRILRLGLSLKEAENDAKNKDSVIADLKVKLNKAEARLTALEQELKRSSAP